MANQSPIPKFKNLKVPKGFPDFPLPGKLEMLWSDNKKDIYRRFSPYKTESFIGIKTRQPFQYIYPDDKSTTRGYVSIFKRSFIDTKRMVNFLGSPGGVTFLAKQFLLQTKNAFNETRLYNPTSVIISAASPLLLSNLRPTRHIEKSNLLGSFLGNIGNLIAKGVGIHTEYKPPAGTVGYGALADKNSSHGKGLIRAHTANEGKSRILLKWGKSEDKKQSLIKSIFSSIFGNFITQKQQDVEFRSDEMTYELMLSNNREFSYDGKDLSFSGTNQRWYGGYTGKKHIRKNGKIPSNTKKIIIDNFNIFQLVDFDTTTFTVEGQEVGYKITSTNTPVRYGDYVGVRKTNSLEGGSEILSIYSIYSDESKHFKTKFSTDFVDKSHSEVVDSLKKTIQSINISDIYEWSEGLIKSNYEGYNDIKNRKTTSEIYVEQYEKQKVIDDGTTPLLYGRSSLKFSTSKRFDAVNILEVLDKNKKIKNSPYPDWEEWKPYSDDLIAFYFYDLVNQKYIPFRATLKTLNEDSSASWEQMEFAGRADKIYHYNGFIRSLNLSFTVYISSIKELLPTWKRINYLSGLIMPARYVKAEINPNEAGEKAFPGSKYSRFIVPPMVLLTVGDFYKDQPIVITSLTKTIPERARWETLSEDSDIKEWTYLAGSIKLKDKNVLYAQLPNLVDISISANILEKERPNVGNALIGNAFHTEDYAEGVYSKNGPNSKETPNTFDRNLVVYQR